MDLETHMRSYQWQGVGRKRKDRMKIVKAFVAKAIYNFETTEILIEYLKGCKNLRRLCGWENSWQVPSKSTFSRAFTQFSDGHISRDSTAIEVREKPVKKISQEHVVQSKRKPGRPRKGEVVAPKAPKRLDQQPERTLEENLKDLPSQCNVGTKKNSKGYKESWIGYKLHLDCIDGDIPVSAILTSASLHDSQAAIPLSQMSSGRITNLYDLMDSAYDAPQIHGFSEKLGHKPIIDHNPRGGEKRYMDPATHIRFAERSSAERVNSNLKDNYGGRNIRVKGAVKVMTHLMFGIIVITATQLFRLLQ
ncbi:MAG: transposase [Deltaproteobacteria bacterium]|nr:transposase [Deltaproteobacteria bacterium]